MFPKFHGISHLNPVWFIRDSANFGLYKCLLTFSEKYLVLSHISSLNFFLQLSCSNVVGVFPPLAMESLRLLLNTLETLLHFEHDYRLPLIESFTMDYVSSIACVL